MLVLSRKPEESIIIYGPDKKEIKITLIKIESTRRVKIGIEASDEYQILRQELTEKDILACLAYAADKEHKTESV